MLYFWYTKREKGRERSVGFYTTQYYATLPLRRTNERNHTCNSTTTLGSFLSVQREEKETREASSRYIFGVFYWRSLSPARCLLWSPHRLCPVANKTPRRPPPRVRIRRKSGSPSCSVFFNGESQNLHFVPSKHSTTEKQFLKCCAFCLCGVNVNWGELVCVCYLGGLRFGHTSSVPHW